MDLIQMFAQFGVPTLILGFILVFIIKPFVDSHVKFINQQTELLQNMNNDIHEMKSDINIIKSDVSNLKSIIR